MLPRSKALSSRQNSLEERNLCLDAQGISSFLFCEWRQSCSKAGEWSHATLTSSLPGDRQGKMDQVCRKSEEGWKSLSCSLGCGQRCLGVRGQPGHLSIASST